MTGLSASHAAALCSVVVETVPALKSAAALVLALSDPRRAHDERDIAPLAADLAQRLIALGYLTPPAMEQSRVQDA